MSSASPPARLHRLRPPAIADALERPRLTASIRAGAARGCLVVSAPVGFGATTAVAHALGAGPATVWMSLDALDAEPAAFARQLAQAVGGVTGRVAGPVSSGALELAARVIDDLAGVEGAVVVLDGVDVRRHGAALQVVAYLCDSLPHSSSLVITTHDDVSTLPIPALAGRLRVLGQDDLALLPDEATQIVVETCPQLGADLVDEVVLTAGGWVAACREAALHAVDHPDARAIEWLRGQGCEHLTAAALATTTPAGAQLLLETAILDELSAPLCDAVLERDDSSVGLSELHLHGSLVRRSDGSAVPAHGGPAWVRHPLLTAGLRRRLYGRNLSDVHRRAADWYRSAGDLDGTMNHLVAAGDFAAAGEHLSLHEDALYESGEADRAAAWYVSLPPEAWGRRGWHLLRASWGRAFTGDVRGAEVTLEQLRVHLTTSPALNPEEATLHGEAELLTSYLAGMRGDADAVVRHAARAVDLVDSGTPVNSTQLAPILLLRGLTWRDDLDAAVRQMARVDHQAFPTDLLREAALGAQRSRLLLLEGKVTLALHQARRAMEWLDSQGLDAQEVGQYSLLTTLAAAGVESGRPGDADAVLEGIVESALRRAYVGDAVDALRWQTRARVVVGDLQGALASLTRARSLLLDSAGTSSMTRPLDLQEAWVRHLAGDNVRAERIVQALPHGDARTLMWARLSMQRQGSRALSALAEVSTRFPRHAAERQALLARAAMRRSSRLAESHLVQAADIASQHGLGLVFLGCGTELLDLAVVLGSRVGHDGLVALATSARDGYRPMPSSTAAAAASSENRALSPGEIQLLAFLPTRDTNDDIAKKLGISVNTVKTRVARLYRKLGVTNRDEAIAVARQRGLIG